MIKRYPVVLFAFKRPSNTKVILDLIASANIQKIYIFADGPRNDSEKILTQEVKKVIATFTSSHNKIKVITNISNKNLGLKKTITNGLNAIFKYEKAAIILEDDCLPSLDFFKFTSLMLTKYENNKQIMSVAGTSVGSFSPTSYNFSRYQLCWGWATWKRAWDLYDPQMKEFKTAKWKSKLSQVTGIFYMQKYWNMMLSIVQSGWLNTWDYQWTYTLFIHYGLAIIPSSNLVSNIGFDSLASNTKFKSNLANMTISSLSWPLSHPEKVVENKELSHQIEQKFYNNPIAIAGMLRQYIYWKWNSYANRH